MRRSTRQFSIVQNGTVFLEMLLTSTFETIDFVQLNLDFHNLLPSDHVNHSSRSYFSDIPLLDKIQETSLQIVTISTLLGIFRELGLCVWLPNNRYVLYFLCHDPRIFCLITFFRSAPSTMTSFWERTTVVHRFIPFFCTVVVKNCNFRFSIFFLISSDAFNM